MQTKTDKEKLSFHQQNKEILSKAIKIKTNKKIHEADEINTLTLNNQSKCLEQKQIDFTIEKGEVENINTETSTEKAGIKINVFQNKSKIPHCENRRPTNCITEKYLQNNKNREKRKEILLTLLHLKKNAHYWG